MTDPFTIDPATPDPVRSAIESLIFIANRPVPIDELKQVFPDVQTGHLHDLIDALRASYETDGRGFRIVEIAGGYAMVTAPENAPVVKQYYKIKNTERLSGPSLETLAIVAYKQPVTRVDIEAIRGVNVDGVVRSLQEKNLIRIVGRKEVIGRPFVYGTTRFFLDYFGLRSLEELPRIEEFAQQDALLDMKLASGDADITPLTKEEEAALSQDTTPASEQETTPTAPEGQTPTSETDHVAP